MKGIHAELFPEKVKGREHLKITVSVLQTGTVTTAKYFTNFIELDRFYTTQLTVVFYNWLHREHVSALLGHHQAYKE